MRTNLKSTKFVLIECGAFGGCSIIGFWFRIKVRIQRYGISKSACEWNCGCFDRWATVTAFTAFRSKLSFCVCQIFLLNFSVIFVQPSSNLEMWRGQVQCFYNLQKSGGVINCKVILWTDTYLHTFLDLSTRRQKVRILLQFVFCYLCFEHYLKKSTALYKTRDLRITWTLFVVSSF